MNTKKEKADRFLMMAEVYYLLADEQKANILFTRHNKMYGREEDFEEFKKEIDAKVRAAP